MGGFRGAKGEIHRRILKNRGFVIDRNRFSRRIFGSFDHSQRVGFKGRIKTGDFGFHFGLLKITNHDQCHIRRNIALVKIILQNLGAHCLDVFFKSDDRQSVGMFFIDRRK